MDQKPVFRRRHFGNPAVFNILVTNYVVAAFGLAIFVNSQHKLYWFFWVVMGGVAVYNVFALYKNREELDKVSVIAYIIGLAGMGLLFLAF
ncbi:hypothetical protein [Mucilaginibacter ginsenosidivorans]|uniref:Uncharacterized protein n=1 Tax=Mucilaginibacter ginsenosidivorans TaxID=398053 RepID=A0A5B8URW0_9SPHI|nr:hypothetical protein [Mucilaginibacter ginsenosidivorans]QEC61131.1 hypothetical protein FRZ54_00555 [Mucilaginibacter ginsenosidivorans]